MNNELSRNNMEQENLVIHHYLCAYVGPKSDYLCVKEDMICPKCQRKLRPDNSDWEYLSNNDREFDSKIKLLITH